jgi:hypothetical protein
MYFKAILFVVVVFKPNTEGGTLNIDGKRNSTDCD